MPSYTQSQVSTLQGYINAAQAALNQGDSAGVISALNSYYDAQTGMRGYATDALQVLNNTGVFGNVANQEITDAMGQSWYNKNRTTLAFNLANSDLQTIIRNGNQVPTENQIANYHAQDFTDLGINPTFWGGAAGASLGQDWAQGTLTPAETDADLSQNTFSQNFTADQALAALTNLQKAGVETLSFSPSSAATTFNGFLNLQGFQQLFDQKYHSTIFQRYQMPSNTPSVPTTVVGSNGQFITVAQAQDVSNGIVDVAAAITQGDGSLGLYTASTGSQPFANVATSQNTDGSSSLRFATPDEEATLRASSIDPTQVAYNGNGSFTFGSPQADPNGLVNQLNVNGTFGVSGLSVTDTATGAVSTIALDNGSTTTLMEGMNATGAPNEQAISTQANGQVDDAIVGQGAVANVSNANVMLEQQASATIVGNQNTVSDSTDAGPVLTGRSVAIDGNTNNFQGGPGDAVAIDGAKNTASNVTSGVITISDNSNNTTVSNASGDTVDMGAAVFAKIKGTGDIVNFTANSGDSINLFGTNQTVTGDIGDSGVQLYGDGTNATVDGGGYVGLHASDQGVTLGDQGSTVVTDAGITGFDVGGASYIAYLGGGDSGTFGGTQITLNLYGADGGEITSGTGNVINNEVAGDVFNLDSNTQTTITGSGGYFGVTGTNVNVTASNETSDTSAAASFILTGTGDNLTLGLNASAALYGGGDILALNGGGLSDYSLLGSGTGYVVNGDVSGSGLNLGSGTQATINGSGGYFGVTGTNVDVTASNEIAATWAGVSFDLQGAGNNISVGAGSSATLGGSYNTLNLYGADGGEITSGTGNVINNDVAGDVFNLDSNTQTTITGSSGYFGVTGTNVDVDASNEIAATWAGVSFDLQGQGNNISVGAGSSATLGGSDNTLNMTGASGDYAAVSGSGEIVTGDNAGNSVNVYGNSTSAIIDGAGGYVGILSSGDAVNLGDIGDTLATAGNITGLTVNGTGYDLDLAGGDSGTFGGTQITLNLSGADGGEITSGTGNVINNDVAGDIFNLDSNTQTTITGSGGYFGVTGTNVNVDASNETSDTSAGASFILTGTGDNLTLGSDASAALYAGYDSLTLNVCAPSSYSLLAAGTGYVVNNDVFGSGLNLASNTSATINGSGGYFGVVGTGVNVTASNETSYTSVGASYNLTGIDNSLILAMNADVNVAGSGNVLGLNGGDYAYITNGTSETVNNDVAGDSVNLGGGTQTTITGSGGYFGVVGTGVNVTASSEMSDTMDGASYDLTGGGNVLTVGASSSATISGSGNTLVLNSSDNVSIATGTNEILYNEGTEDGVSFVGDSTSGTVYGDGSVAMLASNQSVTLASAGETLVSAGGVTNEAITASGDTIYEAAGVTANLHGSNDVVSLTSGTSDYLGVFGTGEMITAGNTDLIGVQTASSATVSGTGATTLLNGSNATVNVTSSQETIDETPSLSGDVINAQANYEYIGASNTTINVQAGESVFVNGADDKIVLASNSGSVVAIQGTYDTVVSSGNSIVENSAQTSVTEIGGNTVYINGNDDTLNGNGAGGLVDIKNGITTYIHDDGITLNESSSDTVNFDGSSSYVNSNEYSITYIYGAGNGDNYSYNNVRTGSGAFGGDEASSYDNSQAEASYVAYDPSLNAGDQNNGSDPAGTGEEYSPGVSYNYGYSNPDSVDYSADYGDPGGGEDFVAGAAVLADPSQSNLNVVASYDASVGATAQATQAIAGYAQATLAASSTTLDGAATTAVLTGAAWEVPIAADGSRTITWSFATSAGPVADPFSSYIGAQYQATFEQALQTWSDATGLTFKEVADSPDANIRVGFGDFDTGTSGILGYTDTNAVGGAQQSAIIRLEDPTETPLVSDLTGQSIYQGSEATLYQVALHEIGRALGFADNADPSSVMYAGASALNRSLDATDLAGAQILYGGLAQLTQAPATVASSTSLTTSTSSIGQSGAYGLNQLIQAMATLTPQQTGTAPIQIGAQNTSLAQQLAAPLHH